IGVSQREQTTKNEVAGSRLQRLNERCHNWKTSPLKTVEGRRSFKRCDIVGGKERSPVLQNEICQLGHLVAGVGLWRGKIGLERNILRPHIKLIRWQADREIAPDFQRRQPRPEAAKRGETDQRLRNKISWNVPLIQIEIQGVGKA